MATKGAAGFDGTTGRSDHGGRRTHIIQILRDSPSAVSVDEVAKKVGIHVNTARFHLESLVDAGLATRETQTRNTPGRPKVLYVGTLPNQTHERAQGYRLLAEILTTMIAQSDPDASERIYAAGKEWGRYLTTRPAPFEKIDENELAERVVDKLDALWFAPELRNGPDNPPHLLLHNCPFIETAKRNRQIVCSLHAGMINGSLEELGSTQRVVDLEPQVVPHLCRGWLGPAPDRPMTQVTIAEPGSIGLVPELAEDSVAS